MTQSVSLSFICSETL